MGRIASGGLHAAAWGTSMALPEILKDKLRLPVVGAPLFIVSHPALVIAQCKAGIVGAFPALNARPISQLDEWLHEITEALAAHDRVHPESPAAPFAVARWDPPIMSGRAPCGAAQEVDCGKGASRT